MLCYSVAYLVMPVCRAARAAAIAEAEAAAGEASAKALRSRRVVGDSLMRTAREVGTCCADPGSAAALVRAQSSVSWASTAAFCHASKPASTLTVPIRCKGNLSFGVRGLQLTDWVVPWLP